MWRPAKRIFIEENDREAKKRERGREREKRKDPMGGIIRSRGNECIFFGARLPPFFNSCPSHSCEPTNGVPDHPFPLKLCVSHPLGRKPEGGGGRGEKGRRPARRARGYNASRGIIFYRINGL